MLTVVAILTVRREALEKFRAYERHAAAVMATHGGRIERTVIVEPEGSPETLKEIHVLTFPGAEAFAAYREDPRLAERAALREQSVLHTEVLVGVEGPSYAADGAKFLDSFKLG
jgi:uncharacterized protein (DUF1330 family)